MGMIQVVGRQKPALHQEYCSDIWGVVFSVSSRLCGFFEMYQLGPHASAAAV